MIPDIILLMLLWFPGGILFYYTALSLLTPKYKLHICFMSFSIVFIVMMSIRIILIETGNEPGAHAFFQYAYTAINVLLLFLFVSVTCREKIIKKFYVTVMLYVILMLAEYLTLSVFSVVWGERFSIALDIQNLGGPLTVLIVQAAFCSALIIFWNRKKIETREDFASFGLFLLLPISQILFLTGHISSSIQHGFNFSIPIFAGAIIGFIANLVLLRLLFANAQKHKLEARLKELEHIQELERARFESIEAKQYELAKIRHDFNNQLVTAYRLVEQNKHGEAAGMLNALSAELTETQEKLYCANHVINVVLAEKQMICEIAGIALEIHVTLDENCAIASLHLCSVFSNLLDNAISACRESPGSVISLTALSKGDYLHIKCVNPISKEAETGSGYGTRILADITERYDGAYNAETVDGQYCAVISLLCTE